MSETPIVPKKRLLAYGATLLAVSALGSAVLASASRENGGAQALPQFDSQISGDLATGVGASTPPAEYGSLPTSPSDAVSGPGSVEGAGDGALATGDVPVTFDQSLFAGPTSPVSNPTPQPGATTQPSTTLRTGATPPGAPKTSTPTTTPRPVVTAPAASAPPQTSVPQPGVTTPRPVTTQPPSPTPVASGMPNPVGCTPADKHPQSGTKYPDSSPGDYELQTGWNCDKATLDARPLLEYFTSQGWTKTSTGWGTQTADMTKGSGYLSYGTHAGVLPEGQTFLILTIE